MTRDMTRLLAATRRNWATNERDHLPVGEPDDVQHPPVWRKRDVCAHGHDTRQAGRRTSGECRACAAERDQQRRTCVNGHRIPIRPRHRTCPTCGALSLHAAARQTAPETGPTATHSQDPGPRDLADTPTPATSHTGAHT